MNKEEFSKRVRSHYLDKDKEKAVVIHDEIAGYIRELRKNVDLKAKYEGLRFCPLGNDSYIEVKHRKLLFRLEENKIKVVKSEIDEEQILDEIIVENEIPRCKHGNFTVEEIDKYITECFTELL